MRLAIGSRFALLSAGLVLAVGALVALGGYLTLRASLLDQAAGQAADQARQLAALVDLPGVTPAPGQPQNLVDLGDPALSRDFVRGGLLVEVARPDGTVVQRSPAAHLIQAGATMRQACLATGTASRRQDDPPLAVACRRVGSRGAPAAVMLVGAPLDGAVTSLTRLRDALIVGLVAGVALAGIAGLALARRALRPARRIAETANTIRSGDLTGRIGYSGPRDELGELAAVLDACFAELEQAVERQRRFVADASHELKTPVAALRAHAELLRGWAAVDPKARQVALASLDQATRRMARLVADLLYLAELDRAPPSPRLPVRLDEVLLAVVAEAGALRPDVAIRVRQLDEAVVTGDEVRLQAVLLNLIDNALRVSDAGEEVDVALHAMDGKAVACVRDRGPGIPDEAIGQIFDRFYRAPTRDAATGGTGLGLAIARQIARAHGGELAAANEEPGATLRLVLPLSGTTNLHPAITGLLPARHSVQFEDDPPTGGR
jgi:two-component system OmpR family sensor kinase